MSARAGEKRRALSQRAATSTGAMRVAAHAVCAWRPHGDRTPKGGELHMWMDGWDWFWMSFMMVFWIALLGAVVYVAVKLANRPPTHPKSHS
jgi:hypothetical protein